MTYVTFHERLNGPVIETLKKELRIKNIHALPRIEKVMVNVGINKSKMDSKEMHAYILESIGKITGQQPIKTKARKAISNFKTREGMVVGSMVTLRGKKMEDFLDRLISYSLPRIRDFRGLSTKMDGHGNYSLGIRDHSIFAEIEPPDAREIFGMQIQITTTAIDDEQGMALLKAIGVPFKRKKDEEAEAEANKPAPKLVLEEDESSDDKAKEDKEEKKEKAEEIDSKEETTDTPAAEDSPNPTT